MGSKADRLADSNHGAEVLDQVLTAIEGPDWRPKGNGLLPTHFVPEPGRGRVAHGLCGAAVELPERSLDPTCADCRARLRTHGPRPTDQRPGGGAIDVCHQ